MSILLSVIIVNYNGKDYLDNCIQSIYNQFSTKNIEIIIVDNNSTDQSVAFIKNRYKDIVLIESKQNLGFGKGNNLGVKNAQGKYILLLNNDTILLDKIDDCITYLEDNHDVGVIGINMLNAKKEYLLAAGDFPNVLNLIRFKKLFKSTPEFISGNFSQKYYDVDWLTGSFLMMKKNVYQQINGFDEDYFMYVEDIDICKKIASINLKRIFIANKSYIHFVGFNREKNKFIIEGLKIYIKKHHKNFFENRILSCALILSKVIKFIKK
ncbi:glycosyltransferase family 2 protein [Empedobacter falsenii]